MAKRKPKKSIFIACEGTNTEPLYFENIREIEEDIEEYPYSITIYPDRECDVNPKTDALGLVNVAIEAKNNYDEVWVVFDKDGYTKHKEVFELAEANSVNIAFSSISFETWVLLHFERNNNQFIKSANIINEKFINNEAYLINYNKTGDFNVYPYLSERIEIAYQNAAWVRKVSKEHNIFDNNPYTNVDILVKHLTLNNTVNQYLKLDEAIELNKIKFKFFENKGMIFLSLENNSESSFVTNSIKLYSMVNNVLSIRNTLIRVDVEIEITLFKLGEYQTIFMKFGNQLIEVDCGV